MRDDVNPSLWNEASANRTRRWCRPLSATGSSATPARLHPRALEVPALVNCHAYRRVLSV